MSSSGTRVNHKGPIRQVKLLDHSHICGRQKLLQSEGTVLNAFCYGKPRFYFRHFCRGSQRDSSLTLRKLPDNKCGQPSDLYDEIPDKQHTHIRDSQHALPVGPVFQSCLRTWRDSLLQWEDYKVCNSKASFRLLPSKCSLSESESRLKAISDYKIVDRTSHARHPLRSNTSGHVCKIQ
jgi:hypothetical protein